MNRILYICTENNGEEGLLYFHKAATSKVSASVMERAMAALVNSTMRP
jgi:hypothetical protein